MLRARLTIPARLRLGFSLMFGAVLVLGAASLVLIFQVASLNEEIYLHPFTVTNAMRDIRGAARDVKGIVEYIDAEIGQAESDDAQRRLGIHLEVVHRLLPLTRERYLGPAADIDAVEQCFEGLQPILDALFLTHRQWPGSGAFLIAKTAARQNVNDMIEKTLIVIDYADNKGRWYFEQTRDWKQRALIVIVGMLVLSAGLGGVIAQRLATGVIGPIKRLSGAVERIKAGDLYQTLPVTGHDELARLALVFNAMVHRLRTTFASLVQARESAESVTRLKSEFLANVTHEMRTPLNGILGMLHILQDSPLDEDQQDYAATAELAAERLARLIDRLLEYAASDESVTLAEEDFPLADLTRSLAGEFEAAARDKGLALAVDLDPDAPLVACADSARLRTALRELLDNALKFTEAGSVTLRVYASPGPAPETPFLHFEVEDSGPGIAAEKIESLLQPFTQLDASRARRHGGLGLGLHLARKIAGLLRGQLTLGSPPATRGALARLSVPVRVHCP